MEQEQNYLPHALVIEDEIPLAGIFAKALQYAGFLTEELYDGQEALEWLQVTTTIPALVLIDFHLPLVTGRDLLRYIRSDIRYAKTRVIMATSDPAAMAGEAEKKADLILLKPISYTQLRDLASRFR